jgi:hypothetical protein
MSLFSGAGLIVSLPGAEVERINWRGSLAELHEVLGAPLSLELRLAVQVVRDAACRHGMRTICVARPELFCEGVSARWLRTHAPGFTQHLCLSDGLAVKKLPGFTDHVFFYGLSLPHHVASLRRLALRAPESLHGIESQVNTRVAFLAPHTSSRPAPISIWASTAQASPRAAYRHFFLNIDSAEDTASRVAARAPVTQAELASFKSGHYLPLTATAMSDPAFARTLAERIQQGCFDPNMMLILRLPVSGDGENPLLAGIAAILPALRETGVVIPRSSIQNIFISTEDMDEDLLRAGLPPLHLTVHESFDFWRHTQTFYREFAGVSVLRSRNRFDAGGETQADVTSVYGPGAVVRRLPGLPWEIRSLHLYSA